MDAAVGALENGESGRSSGEMLPPRQFFLAENLGVLLAKVDQEFEFLFQSEKCRIGLLVNHDRPFCWALKVSVKKGRIIYDNRI